MQSKLTLRMEDAVIRKAKRLARKKGKSVSRIVSDYFLEQPDEKFENTLPPITASMLGILARDGIPEVGEKDYKKYLEEKYL